MKILLTGALGFIGKNFLLHRPKDWQVFALDIIEDKSFQKNIQNASFFKIDLADDLVVKKLALEMPKFDTCLHLAANGDPAPSVSNPLWDLRATTQTLINVGTYFAIDKLIYLSSGAVYDGNVGLVDGNVGLVDGNVGLVDGNVGLVLEKTLVNPKLPYAISHLAAEQYARFFKESGKIQKYVVVRFFGAYGPYEPPRKIYTKLVQHFGIEKKNYFEVRGNGQNLIDAMYVEDAIRALVKLIPSKKTDFTIDLCSGQRMTIDDLVWQSAKVFGQKVKISHTGQVPEYIEFYADPKKFQEIFSFKPKISLAEGLKKLHQFYEKQ